MSNKIERSTSTIPKYGKPPRRPQTAYQLFLHENYKSVAEANPGVLVPFVMKEIGKIWRGLSATQRKPYIDTTRILWDQYRSERRYRTKTSEHVKFPGFKQPKKEIVVKDEIKKKIIDTAVEKTVQVATQNHQTEKVVGRKHRSKHLSEIEVFTEDFKQYNKNRENDIEKLMKKAKALELTIQNHEKIVNNLKNEKRVLIAQTQAAEVIKNQCNKTSDRWINLVLDNMTDDMKQKFGFDENYTVREFGDRLVDIRNDSELYTDFVDFIQTLNFKFVS